MDEKNEVENQVNSQEQTAEEVVENTEEKPVETKPEKEKKEPVETVESRGKKFFARFFGKKENKDTPEITKGTQIKNLHSNFHRDKNKEPDPELFPKKVKIMTWQEEQLLGVNVEDVDLDLQEEIDNLAKEVNAKS